MIADKSTSPGRAESPAEKIHSADILGILEKHRGEHVSLVAVLGDIQARYRYLPQDALRIVAEETGVPLVDVYGAATFYRSFSLRPKGKHIISCCLGTACHVRGAPRIADEIRQQLGISPGETTTDMQYTFETVNCLGACALGPVVVIDGRYFSKVKTRDVKSLLASAVEGLEHVDPAADRRIFPIEVSCPHCGHGLMDADTTVDGRPSIHAGISLDGTKGSIRLSSYYGSYSVKSDPDIPPHTVVEFLCPHCAARLAASWECPMCAAPMVSLALDGGGGVHICSRRGCEYHRLDVV